MEDMRIFLRIIGDVHGKIDQLVELAEQAEYAICLGDVGFEYSGLNRISSNKLKIVSGNHDCYEKIDDRFIYMQTGHWLGDFGVYEVPKFGPIFYVRGGYSIDWKRRTPGFDWWEDEQLTYPVMQRALALYKDVKPAFVVSHECPGSIIDHAFGQKTWDGELLKPSMTAKLLDAMWEYHRPKIHIFGHHHKAWSEEINGTKFQCLPELGFVDFEAAN